MKIELSKFQQKKIEKVEKFLDIPWVGNQDEQGYEKYKHTPHLIYTHPLYHMANISGMFHARVEQKGNLSLWVDPVTGQKAPLPFKHGQHFCMNTPKNRYKYKPKCTRDSKKLARHLAEQCEQSEQGIEDQDFLLKAIANFRDMLRELWVFEHVLQQKNLNITLALPYAIDDIPLRTFGKHAFCDTAQATILFLSNKLKKITPQSQVSFCLTYGNDGSRFIPHHGDGLVYVNQKMASNNLWDYNLSHNYGLVQHAALQRIAHINPEVYVVGGYIRDCLKSTLGQIVEMFSSVRVPVHHCIGNSREYQENIPFASEIIGALQQFADSKGTHEDIWNCLMHPHMREKFATQEELGDLSNFQHYGPPHKPAPQKISFGGIWDTDPKPSPVPQQQKPVVTLLTQAIKDVVFSAPQQK